VRERERERERERNHGFSERGVLGEGQPGIPKQRVQPPPGVFLARKLGRRS
jgi:hypothetical protein